MNSVGTPKANKLVELNGCPLLASVPSTELQRDCPAARILSLRHRDTIYRQGVTNQAVFCLLKGQVTLARVNEEGAALTTAALSAGDFFGDGLDGSAEAEDTAKARERPRCGGRRSTSLRFCCPITRNFHLDISQC